MKLKILLYATLLLILSTSAINAANAQLRCGNGSEFEDEIYKCKLTNVNEISVFGLDANEAGQVRNLNVVVDPQGAEIQSFYPVDLEITNSRFELPARTTLAFPNRFRKITITSSNLGVRNNEELSGGLSFAPQEEFTVLDNSHVNTGLLAVTSRNITLDSNFKANSFIMGDFANQEINIKKLLGGIIKPNLALISSGTIHYYDSTPAMFNRILILSNKFITNGVGSMSVENSVTINAVREVHLGTPLTAYEAITINVGKNYTQESSVTSLKSTVKINSEANATIHGAITASGTNYEAGIEGVESYWYETSNVIVKAKENLVITAPLNAQKTIKETPINGLYRINQEENGITNYKLTKRGTILGNTIKLSLNSSAFRNPDGDRINKFNRFFGIKNIRTSKKCTLNITTATFGQALFYDVIFKVGDVEESTKFGDRLGLFNLTSNANRDECIFIYENEFSRTRTVVPAAEVGIPLDNNLVITSNEDRKLAVSFERGNSVLLSADEITFGRRSAITDTAGFYIKARKVNTLNDVPVRPRANAEQRNLDYPKVISCNREHQLSFYRDEDLTRESSLCPTPRRINLYGVLENQDVRITNGAIKVAEVKNARSGEIITYLTPDGTLAWSTIINNAFNATTGAFNFTIGLGTRENPELFIERAPHDVKLLIDTSNPQFNCVGNCMEITTRVDVQ